jgi:Protein of unknown function (DUF4058)
MNSPFPGMDPYIEACGIWGDFHHTLIADIQRHLGATVPERYLVRSEERSYLVLADEEGKTEHGMLPDVKVTGPIGKEPPATGTAVAELETDVESVSMEALVVDEHRESFIEIYEAGEKQQLVTVIEVLSPSNKKPRSKGWKLYHRKRQSLLIGGANFVEIDLLRGGRKMPMLQPWPRCPYTLLVSRRSLLSRCRVWLGWSLKPLPVIPIPLLRPDPDVSLALQPLIETIYARNRYHRSIDYTKPLQPPLAETEAVFLAEQLRTRDSSS